MGSKTGVGRVGKLAAALGVGAAMFMGWGCSVASADDSPSPPSTSDSSTPSDPDPRGDVGEKREAQESAESLTDNNNDLDDGLEDSDEDAPEDSGEDIGEDSDEEFGDDADDEEAGGDDAGSKKRDTDPTADVVHEPETTVRADEDTTSVDDSIPDDHTGVEAGLPPAAPVTAVDELRQPVTANSDGSISDDLTAIAAVDSGPPVSTTQAELSAPTAGGTPSGAPVAMTPLWTVLGAARRGTDIMAPTAYTTADVAATSQVLDVGPEGSISYTDKPTFFDQIVVFSLRVMRGVSSLIGVDVYGLLAKVLESEDPPWFVKHGLDVRSAEYEVSDGDVWQVWEFHPPNPTGKTVVAVHGGGFVVRPLVTHWGDYSGMARDTGATVIVPMYPLATTEAGAASKVVPGMAQFISAQIALRGAENVSVYADSAGTILAMSAVRQLVLNGRAVPSSMVLLSPAPDASLSNPAIRDIDDPVIDVDNLDFYNDGSHWADGYDPKDPMVSPLFIENTVLAGFPPTTIYIGTLEIGLPDTLLLHEAWNAAGGKVSVVVGQGQIHDWALGGSINSQASKVRPDIHRQLGLNGVAAGPNTTATEAPSWGDQLTVFGIQVLGGISEFIGIDLFTQFSAAMSSSRPPFFTTLGLNVGQREHDGWTVWEIAPDNPSQELVVALHGGGFVYEPNLIHWFDYASMARDTGATVLVPIYPLAPPKGTGTATTLVPAMADFVSALVDQYGAEQVSVYADSAGATLAMLSVQEMVRRCRVAVVCDAAGVLPSRMVLISPALNTDLSGPEVDVIDDPVLTPTEPGEPLPFNDGLDPRDPRVNPVEVGDLTGLPPTTVYIGSREILYPGALEFRNQLLAQDPDADFTLVIGNGQIHNWAQGGVPANSQAPKWRPNVYRQLGLLPEDVAIPHSV